MSIYIPTNTTDYVLQSQLQTYTTLSYLNTSLASKLNVTSNNTVIGATGVFDNNIQSNAGNNISITNTPLVGPQNNCVAIGVNSCLLQGGNNAIGIGSNACYQSSTGTNLGFSSIGIGTNALQTRYGYKTIALGYNTGNSNCGNECVLIGSRAGQNNCPSNTIVLDCTNSTLSPSTPGVYIGGIQGRSGTGKVVNSLHYDTITKEIYYIIS